ncbi:putative RNA helicase [Helianthus anomalus]
MYLSPLADRSLRNLYTLHSLDTRGFSKYLGGAKVVHVMWWQFPVDILYIAQPETDCFDAALVTIFEVFA